MVVGTPPTLLCPATLPPPSRVRTVLPGASPLPVTLGDTPPVSRPPHRLSRDTLALAGCQPSLTPTPPGLPGLDGARATGLLRVALD